MRRIGGLDTSLTSTGIAIITRRVNGTCLANVTTITSRGHRNATLTDRSERLITIRNEILYALALCELIVVEGPAFGTKGGSPLDRYGLWWAVVGKLLDINVSVAVCPPTVNKKFITGSGSAGKGAVCAAITRLWPDVDLGNKEKESEDKADALSLAHIGAVKAGWEVPTLQRHRDALPAVAWPDQPVTELEETA
jgi:Holliday junction resolvasome RuvABC endonuclease subunit